MPKLVGPTPPVPSPPSLNAGIHHVQVDLMVDRGNGVPRFFVEWFYSTEPNVSVKSRSG